MNTIAPRSLRILIVAENVSAKFGGEAFLPLQYFERLLRRGVDVRLVTHGRVREQLLEQFGNHADRLHFVEDTAFDIWVSKASQLLPRTLATVSTDAAIHLETQFRQRPLVRRLVEKHGIDIVHKPIPVSPKLPTAVWNVGAPVLIGPMNGGMNFPPAFRAREAASSRGGLRVARMAAELANMLIPGKRRASLLLVANARTRAALPRVVASVPTEELVENGVDLARFARRAVQSDTQGFTVAFVGRLVDWKAVDLLLEALKLARETRDIRLELFGDGPMRGALEAQVARLGLDASVSFHGFVPQEQISERLQCARALVLPSLYECGGAVVLEAMALGLPVIATRWGGPADYLDDSCGILIDPTSHQGMVASIADALTRLASDPALAERLAAAALRKAESYDWEKKIDVMLATYERVIAGTLRGQSAATSANDKTPR